MNMVHLKCRAENKTCENARKKSKRKNLVFHLDNFKFFMYERNENSRIIQKGVKWNKWITRLLFRSSPHEELYAFNKLVEDHMRILINDFELRAWANKRFLKKNRYPIPTVWRPTGNHEDRAKILIPTKKEMHMTLSSGRTNSREIWNHLY